MSGKALKAVLVECTAVFFKEGSEGAGLLARLTPISSQPAVGPPSACKQCLKVVFLMLRLAELSLKEGRAGDSVFCSDGHRMGQIFSERAADVCSCGLWSLAWASSLFKSGHKAWSTWLGAEGQYFPPVRRGHLCPNGSRESFCLWVTSKRLRPECCTDHEIRIAEAVA